MAARSKKSGYAGSFDRAERQRQNRMRKPSTRVREPNYSEMEMRAYGPGYPGVGGARYVTPKPMTGSESAEYRRQTRNGARGGKSVRAVPLKPKQSVRKTVKKKIMRGNGKGK